MPVRPARADDDLAALIDRVDRRSGYEALTEAALLAIEAGEGTTAIAEESGRLEGLGHRYSDHGRDVAETAVLPSVRARHAGPLLDALVAPGEDVWIWASDVETDVAARARGFEERRRLLELVRPLPIDEEPRFPSGVAVDTFTPDADEDELIRVNNAAFEGHPDNSSWDRAELAERMARAWFRPEDIAIASIDGAMVGFCWTKLHPGDVGEIYVIGVHPDAQGMGLGRALVLQGLDHMHRDRGATSGILYTEADNTGARALYESLGFGELRVQRGLSRG
ncbi:MAG: mycothiol synthase [Acidimicrobiia bacterium]|nr:mycothiol synthase [Acidimicrobiia bacterium]